MSWHSLATRQEQRIAELEAQLVVEKRASVFEPDEKKGLWEDRKDLHLILKAAYYRPESDEVVIDKRVLALLPPPGYPHDRWLRVWKALCREDAR